MNRDVVLAGYHVPAGVSKWSIALHFDAIDVQMLSAAAWDGSTSTDPILLS